MVKGEIITAVFAKLKHMPYDFHSNRICLEKFISAAHEIVKSVKMASNDVYNKQTNAHLIDSS
jgi:hypothetical protein